MERYNVRVNSAAILNGPIIPTFLRLGLPLLLVRLIQDIYGLVDAFWLSRYSQFAMAVPRQVWPSYMLFTAFIMSFASANLALISQYVGAEMYDSVNNVVKKMLFIAMASGVAFGAAFFYSSPYILEYFVDVPPEMLRDAVAYAQIMGFDILLLSVNISLATIVQALGDTKTVALSQIVGALANVVLDPVFINGLHPIPAMGAAGAALATALSKIFSILVMIVALTMRYRWLEIGLTHSVDKGYLILTLSISLPLMFMNISNSLAFNLQNRLANAFGAIAATAIAIGFLLFDLANTSLWGLTDGIAIMVGQNLGAENIERAKVIAKKTSLFIFLSVAASSVIIYLARDSIASVFITGYSVDRSAVESIYAEYNKFVTTTIWTLAFFGLTFSAMSVGRGSGHTLAPTVINLVRLWGVRIGLGYLLALVFNMNTDGIYIAFALSNIVGGILSAIWINMGLWAKPVIKNTPKEFKPIRVHDRSTAIRRPGLDDNQDESVQQQT